MNRRLRGEARALVAAELAARYRAGATIQQIADATGRSYAGVHKLLSAAEVDFRPNAKIHGPDRKAFIARLVRRYEGGESIRAIAADVGLSYTAVRDMLVAEHVMFRQRGGARGSW